MFQGAAGHRLPGHLLVQVLLDDVVMLDELSKLLIGVIAAAAWKVHIVEYGLARSYGWDDARKTLVSTGWKDQSWT